MSADTLIELAAILIAVYAILPRARRLEVRIRFTRLYAILSAIALIAILVLLYYPTATALGLLPKWPLDSINLAPEKVAFLVLLVLGAWAAYLLAVPRLGTSQAIRFRDLVEELIRTRDFASLFSMAERHLSHLLSVCYSRQPILRLRAALVRRASEPPPTRDDISGLLSRVGNVVHRVLSPLVAWAARRLLSVLPDYGAAVYAANESFRLMATEHQSVLAMATLRPYLALTLVENRIPYADTLLDSYLRLLLRDTESILYHEIRNNQNTSHTCQYLIPPANRLLTFLFSNPKAAEDLGVWRPIGNELLQILDEAARQPELDPGNLPMEDFAEEGRWKSPLYVGIAFFDIMVSSALYEGVPWHMFLWYYLYFTQRIVRNFRSPKGTDSDLAEWPSRYCYLLYLMTSALGRWIEAVPDLAPENPHTTLKRPDCTHENSNIPKSSIMVLCWSLKDVVLSTAVPDRFKRYLADIVFRLYLDLAKDKSLAPLAESLACCLSGGGFDDDSAFRRELLVHFQSFDKIPYRTADVKALEAKLMA